MTYMQLIEPVGDDRTRVTMRVQRPRTRKDQAAMALAWQGVEPAIRAGTEALEGLLREEVERLAAEDAVVAPAPVNSAAAHSS